MYMDWGSVGLKSISLFVPRSDIYIYTENLQNTSKHFCQCKINNSSLTSFFQLSILGTFGAMKKNDFHASYEVIFPSFSFPYTLKIETLPLFLL
jgi:hypothetical protein